jgi:hypothetical protein
MLLAVLSAVCAIASASEKPRAFVLTDIENEPDDAMSMVRLLTYSNNYDVEGLVVTTSIHQRGRVAPQRIRQIAEAYGKVRDHLEKHEPGFPASEWKVRTTRSTGELERFVAKLRVYTISDQDDSGPWLRKEFPDFFYIASPGFNAGGAYHHATPRLTHYQRVIVEVKS